MNKYNQIMEQVQLTPQMAGRILAGVRPGGPVRPRRSNRRIWQVGGLAACLLVVILCATLLPGQESVLPQPPGVVSPNPMTGYPSVEALAQNLDFPLALPGTLPDGYSFVQAMDQGGMALLIYENGGDTLKFYMSQGDAALLAIGRFPVEQRLDGGLTLYGDEQGYRAADWQENGYAYCLSSTAVLPVDMWRSIQGSVKPYLWETE